MDDMTGGGDNQGAKLAEIRSVCEELNAIDAQATAANAKHQENMAPIKKKRKAAKGRVKSLGINQQDIDYFRGIYALEDEDMRRETLRNIAEILPSLGIGESVDWVTMLLGDEADIRPNFLKDRDAEEDEDE